MYNTRLVNFRATVLIPSLRFNVSCVCTNCGCLLDYLRDILLGDISVLAAELVLGKECQNCEGGSFKYIPVIAYQPLMNMSLSSQTLKVIDNDNYLRDAFENPCTLNICTCDKRELYLAVAWDMVRPFVCAYCGKLAIDRDILARQGLTYKGMHLTQVNLFRDFHAYFWEYDTNEWKLQENSQHQPDLKEIL